MTTTAAIVDALVAQKVEQAMANPRPRLELADSNGVIPKDMRAHMLTVSFREIAKAVGPDTLATAPADLLEQFSAIAVQRQHNIKGELVQLVRTFLIAYAYPETTQAASAAIDSLTDAAQRALAMAGMPENMRFQPMPDQIFGSAKPQADALMNVRYWAVSGRIPGDDEDVTHILRAVSRAQAEAAFGELLWDDERDAHTRRPDTIAKHGLDVFITSVVVSDSPIEAA